MIICSLGIENKRTLSASFSDFSHVLVPARAVVRLIGMLCGDGTSTSSAMEYRSPPLLYSFDYIALSPWHSSISGTLIATVRLTVN